MHLGYAYLICSMLYKNDVCSLKRVLCALNWFCVKINNFFFFCHKFTQLERKKAVELRCITLENDVFRYRRLAEIICSSSWKIFDTHHFVKIL